MAALATAVLLAGSGLFLLWIAHSTLQSWRVLRRAAAKEPRSRHVDETLRPIRNRAVALTLMAAVLFAVAFGVAWRGFGTTPSLSSELPAPREVPAALWTLAAPLYGSIVLGVTGLLLCLMAAPSIGRQRKDEARHQGQGARDDAPPRLRNTTALAVGAVCLTLGVSLALGGLATLRTLPAPQRAVFSDCNPVPSGLAALVGVLALGAFFAEVLALMPARWTTSTLGVGVTTSPKRVPWSLLWMAMTLLVAGYVMFVGSCQIPDGSS